MQRDRLLWLGLMLQEGQAGTTPKSSVHEVA